MSVGPPRRAPGGLELAAPGQAIPDADERALEQVVVERQADAGADAAQPDAASDTSSDAASDVSPDVTGPAPFRFAIVADTHIIDEWYEGPESNELDTESMFHTFDRFTAARDVLKALDPPVEFVAHVGDLIHDYPSYDLTFFENNRTRPDIAADIIRTVAVRPDLRSVAVLGGIVLIRTFLSFSLEREVTGYWPWQSRKKQQAESAQK